VAVLAGAVEADCDRSLVRPEMGDGIEVVVEPLGVAVRFPLVDQLRDSSTYARRAGPSRAWRREHSLE
jgi:hypothetical protein